MKQLAKQPGWQDVLTKLYVKESYEAHPDSMGDSSSFEPNYRPQLQRDPALVTEDTSSDMFLSYRTSQDMEPEEEEEDGGQRENSEEFSDLSQSPPSGGGGPRNKFTGYPNFKSFDSADQGSQSSIFNPVDIASSCPNEEGREYQPLSPFGTSPLDLELGGMGDMGPHTPVGSLTNTPSPLEYSKPFPPLRPRKSSSLSNVLDEMSYGTDPPTGDTISNTSNPQVCLLFYLWSLIQASIIFVPSPWQKSVCPLLLSKISQEHFTD